MLANAVCLSWRQNKGNATAHSADPDLSNELPGALIAVPANIGNLATESVAGQSAPEPSQKHAAVPVKTNVGVLIQALGGYMGMPTQAAYTGRHSRLYSTKMFHRLCRMIGDSRLRVSRKMEEKMMPSTSSGRNV